MRPVVRPKMGYWLFPPPLVDHTDPGRSKHPLAGSARVIKFRAAWKRGEESAATRVHFATLMGLIDTLASDGGAQFYVEVVTRHGHRTAKPRDPKVASLPADSE